MLGTYIHPLRDLTDEEKMPKSQFTWENLSMKIHILEMVKMSPKLKFDTYTDTNLYDFWEK